MHAVHAVVVLALLTLRPRGGLRECRHVMSSDDEEGRARFRALTSEVQPLDTLRVGPPRTGHIRIGRIGVRPPQPGGPGPGSAVDLTPRQVESTDEPSLGAPFVGLGQSGVHDHETESAGGPERRLAQTVRTTGAGHGLLTVELPSYDGGEPAGLVVVAGEPGGVVVVDPQEDQPVALVHLTQS